MFNRSDNTQKPSSPKKRSKLLRILLAKSVFYPSHTSLVPVQRLLRGKQEPRFRYTLRLAPPLTALPCAEGTCESTEANRQSIVRAYERRAFDTSENVVELKKNSEKQRAKSKPLLIVWTSNLCWDTRFPLGSRDGIFWPDSILFVRVPPNSTIPSFPELVNYLIQTCLRRIMHWPAHHLSTVRHSMAK